MIDKQRNHAFDGGVAQTIKASRIPSFIYAWKNPRVSEVLQDIVLSPKVPQPVRTEIDKFKEMQILYCLKLQFNKKTL